MMGFFQRSSPNPEEIDLRRPKIPKAPPVPKIIGPRGGPAFLPDPRDRAFLAEGQLIPNPPPERPRPAEAAWPETSREKRKLLGFG